MSFGFPSPDPVVQDIATRKISDDQPYIYRLTRLGVEAARRGDVASFGRLYEVEDFDNKKREKMGLPPVKKIHEDVIKLLEQEAEK